jgi:2'-5' RNA ligase
VQHPFLDNEAVTQSFSKQQLNLHDYLLIIAPSQDVQQKIMAIKKAFAEKFECPAALPSKPHITLLRFVQIEMQERKIINKLLPLIQAAAAFQITVNGFGSFPSHTIYANVATKNNIIDLVKSLRPLQPLVKLDKWNRGHFITEPHITIARKLLPFQYEKGWLEYEHADFKTGFMVNEVLLLRRPLEGKGYTNIAKFSLLNKSIPTVKQETLFS